MSEGGNRAERAPRSAAALAELVRLDTAAGTLRVGDHTIPAPATDADAAGLSSWLYATLHVGNADVFQPDSVLPDVDFEERIRAELTDPGIEVPVSGAAPAGDGRTVAELHRVRLALTEDRVVRGDDGTTRARISCLRPNLTPGFFMYLHDAEPSGPGAADTMTRYYLRADEPEHALQLWASAVARLSAAGASFRTKLLSRRAAYPRNDALVFYLRRGDRLPPRVLGELLADRGEEPSGSPLTAPHPSGLRFAHDPRDPRPAGRERSFGEHRCAVIAEAVVAAARGEAPFADALEAALRTANIDPGDVSLNLDTPDAEAAADAEGALA